MNEVTLAHFLLAELHERFLWVGLRESDDTSLEAARLGLEMVFPGANVQVDPATRGLTVVQEDMRGWALITCDQLQAVLCDAEYVVEIMPGTSPGVVVMELTHAPTYRLLNYLGAIPGVSEVHLVEGLEQFVHLDVSVPDVEVFCQVLWAYMSFGFGKQE